MVGGEQRPKPIGGAWAQEFEDPSTRLVYLIRQALEGMRHANAALLGANHLSADDIGAAYESFFTLRHELEDQAAADMATRARSTVADLSATLASVHIHAEAERLLSAHRETNAR